MCDRLIVLSAYTGATMPCPFSAAEHERMDREWREHEATGCKIPLHLHQLGVVTACPLPDCGDWVKHENEVREPHEWTGSGWVRA